MKRKLSFWARSVILIWMLVAGGSSAWAWSDFALIGNFSSDTWAPIYLDKVNDNHFTGTIDAHSWVNNKTYNFKFYNEENSGATKNYWGSSTWNPDFTTQSSITINEGNNYGNMTFKHNSAYSSYTVDAEYITNYWHVVITGVAAGPTYTVNIGVNASGGGTVSPSGDQTVGASGISVTATPNTGYTFKNWTVGGGATVASSTSATTTITATANGSVTANFQAFTPLTIYLQNDGNWGTPIFAYVYKGDGASAIKNAEWPGANMTALGNGKYSYTINNADLFDGKVIFVGNGSRYPADSQPGLDIESKSKIFNTSTNAWNLSGPSVAFSQASGSTLPKPTSITVTLTGEADGKTYKLHVTKAALSRSSVFPKEESFVMSVASVSHIIDLDEVGVYTFTLKNDADETLATATYTVEEQYDITLSAEAGKGTVSPSGTVKVGSAAVTISAMAASGYQFKQWTTTGGVTVASAASATTTITATSDGTVKALFEDYVAPDMSYYLIGNFMDTDGPTISEENRQDRKFRFFKDTDGSYYFDIPATLNVSNQIVAVSPAGAATVYGPSAGDQTLNTTTIIDNDDATYNLGANDNKFNTVDRDIVSGGMYRYRMTVDTDGLPTSVKITHDKKTLVAYYWPEETTTSPSPTAQPTYTVRKSDGGSDNKYFGNVNLEDGQYCWVISNITKDADTHKASALVTKTRLFKQGNGGGDVINNTKPDGTAKPDGVDYHKVYPYFIHQSKRGDEYKANLEHDGFTFENGGAYTLEYNPSKGADEVTGVSDNQRIGGEVLKASGGPLADPIKTISVIGPGIPASGSWDISTKQLMTYNQQLQCYEYTFTKTTPESDTEHFRFVANDNWKMNWEENGTEPADKARVPYRSTNAGHSAMVDDPNYIQKAGATDASGSDRAHPDTHDIILNRPEGEWTIRFYIKTKPNPDNGNEYLVDYYYTINGSPSVDLGIPVYGGRVLCSFSSHKSLNIPAHFRAYVAHRFTPKEEGSDNTNDGHVDLYRIKYIPANVGVILYGDDPQHNYTTVTVPFTEYEGEDVRDTPALWYYPTKHTGETYKNYLVAAPDGTVLSTNGRLDTRSEYYDEETHTYKYYVYLSRYFAFTWFSKTLYGNYYDWTDNDMAPKSGVLKHGSPSGFPTPITDYASFYRAKGTVGKNRAYLVLPAEIMGYSGQALSQTQDETDPDGKPLFSKSGLRFEDFYYEDYSDEFSTAIQPIVNVANGNTDNTFYNIQGMKVANPTKGLYIINGKKMVVK